jgi:predicted nucleotidyltransferase
MRSGSTGPSRRKCETRDVPQPASGFARALAALREAGVDFVVVGVGGINFYARRPAQVFATVDLDTLLPPAVGNLARALRVLSGLGYAFEAGLEPFVDLEAEEVLARVIANGACLTAIHGENGEIDLMTSIAGFSFAELDADATPFEVAGTVVRVGRLEKLLRSKERSGRPKDREFLRAFAARASLDPAD